MVSGFDMATIDQLNQLGGKGGGKQQQPMNGGKTPQKPAALEPQDPNTVNNPLLSETTSRGGQAGATDLVDKPDTSKGLGSMDKLNMITKMYRGLV